MNPDQTTPQPPTGQQPAPNYDFIFNPDAKSKRQLTNRWIKDPFIMRLLVVVGGGIVLLIAAAVVINLLFSNKSGLADLVTLTASEQEIVRLSDQGKNANDQLVKNAAISTDLSVYSHQRAWLSFLKKYHRTVKPKELVLKKNLKTDQQLAAAQKASNFDQVFSSTMRTQLQNYQLTLQTIYKKSTNKTERAMLASQFKDVALLLQQWPNN